jgi:ribosomal protein L11 methyltransferase
MPCLELSLQTREIYTERISDFLEQAAALSITWKATDEQALFEPELETTPLWQRVTISALYTENTPIVDLITRLRLTFDDKIILNCRYQVIPDKAWERVWLDEFRPMSFGQRLWVCPTLCDVPDPSAITLRLDPGLAFGTGSHPSTALCLEWIDAHLATQQSVIDYGCGSGILALAALKCGAGKAFAIDHDPQALEATAANVELNAISVEKIACLFPHQLLPETKADVLIANILAQPLINLAKDFKRLLKKGACCVLAGILREQVANIQQHYTEQGFTVVDVHYKQDWARLTLHV